MAECRTEITFASTLQLLEMAESASDSEETPIDPEGLETVLKPDGLHALSFEMDDPHNTPPSVRTRWLLEVADELQARKPVAYAVWLDIPLESSGHVIFKNLNKTALM